jgi:hypothetical protein
MEILSLSFSLLELASDLVSSSLCTSIEIIKYNFLKNVNSRKVSKNEHSQYIPEWFTLIHIETISNIQIHATKIYSDEKG